MICSSLNLLRFIFVRLLCVGLYPKSVTFQGSTSTGYQEAVEVLRNTQDFSSAITAAGPVLPLPFTPMGHDITDQIEAHRTEIPATNLLVAQDDTRHGNKRALLNKLFTPSRLRANEPFMRSLADKLVSGAVARGECEMVNGIASPYATLVVANLLDMPEDDAETLRQMLASSGGTANIDNVEDERGAASLDKFLEMMGAYFAGYVADRRTNPRHDVLSELANAKYPDGTVPDMMEIVTLGVFLFAAGGDTSAKLVTNGLRILCEDQDLQQQLRADYSLIPGFLEEVLRIEGSTKMTARLAKRKTRIGDFEVQPGERVAILFSATSHDERRWPESDRFIIGRPKIKEHLAFGRGRHTCVGAPLARYEATVMLETLFDQTSAITLSESHHGPKGNRRMAYEPSYIIRGLLDLHLELSPA